jgi:hypothetical protein
MDSSKPRRSERIALELPISVAGTDGEGQVFLDETVTIVVSRHGAKIGLPRKLFPGQELTLRVLGAPREMTVRVVGQTGAASEVYHYGVELLDPESAAAFWGVEFPEPEPDFFARVILECSHCRTRELVYLNELEAEVLEVNDRLTRFCKRCSDDSLWKPARVSPAETQAAAAAAEAARPAVPAKRTRNDRQHVRLSLRVDVCVRHPRFGEEVAITENVSRGGFRFRSPKSYEVGSTIQAALPYTRGAANIFSSARIVYAEKLSTEKTNVYGVAYVSGPEVRKNR